MQPSDRIARVPIERVGAALGIGAVLLPVAGWLVRLVAFSIGIKTGNAPQLALAAPLGLLAMNGFLGVLGSAAYILLLLVIVRIAPLQYALNAVGPSIE